MKRRIAAIAILAVLLLCGVVWARMTTVVVGQGVSAGGTSYLYDDASVKAVWDFENNLNDSKGAHNLTGTESITYNSTYKKQGTYSVYFTNDPGDMYGSTADSADWYVTSSGGKYTFATWYRHEWDNGAGLISTCSTGAGIRIFFAFSDSNHLHIMHYEGGNETEIDTGWFPTANVAYHIIVAYDSSQANELTVWVSAGTFGSEINGTQYDCAYGAGNYTNVFYVGWDTWNSKCVIGLMDETVWMNGKAVNASEAQSIYDGTWRP